MTNIEETLTRELLEHTDTPREIVLNTDRAKVAEIMDRDIDELEPSPLETRKCQALGWTKIGHLIVQLGGEYTRGYYAWGSLSHHSAEEARTLQANGPRDNNLTCLLRLLAIIRNDYGIDTRPRMSWEMSRVQTPIPESLHLKYNSS